MAGRAGVAGAWVRRHPVAALALAVARLGLPTLGSRGSCGHDEVRHASVLRHLPGFRVVHRQVLEGQALVVIERGATAPHEGGDGGPWAHLQALDETSFLQRNAWMHTLPRSATPP